MDVSGVELCPDDRRRSPSRGWLEVALVAAGIFAQVTTEFLPVGLLGDIAADFRVSEGVAGYMVSVPGLLAAIAAPSLLLLAKGLDRRLALIGVMALVVLSNIILILAPSYSVALAARVLLGISVGGAWTFGVPSGRRLVEPRHGHRATAIIIAAISLATVLGVPVGTYIGTQVGWRAAFAATGALSVAVLVAQLFLLRRLPAERAITAADIIAIGSVPAGRAGLIATALTVAGHFAAFTFLTPFLRSTANMGPEAITGTLFAYGLAGFFGTFAGEWLVGRGVGTAFKAVTLLLGVVLLLAVLTGTTPLLLIAMIALWGVAFGALPVVAQVWMHDASPKLFEGSSALFVAAFQLSIALGSFLGAKVVDAMDANGAFLAGAALAFMAFVSLIFNRAPRSV